MNVLVGRVYPDGDAFVQGHITRFERDHGMSSEAMMSRLADGSLSETSEIATWLFWLSTRAALARGRSARLRPTEAVQVK
jgi:hypothetical protein